MYSVKVQAQLSGSNVTAVTAHVQLHFLFVGSLCGHIIFGIYSVDV